jgi:hypothetical protein
MDRDLKLINDEVEALVEEFDQANWKKHNVFLDDNEFCKQLRRKRMLLAQASWREHSYGIHAKQTGSGLVGFKSPEEDSDKKKVPNPLYLSFVSRVFPSRKSASAKEEVYGPS